LAKTASNHAKVDGAVIARLDSLVGEGVEAHRLLALPGVSRRSRRLLGPLQGLIDDG